MEAKWYVLYGNLADGRRVIYQIFGNGNYDYDYVKSIADDIQGAVTYEMAYNIVGVNDLKDVKDVDK